MLEFALGYPKALDWHMFRFILHIVHMLDKRMDGFVLSFSRTVYSKSEDAEEMSRYHSPLHAWQHMWRPNQADMDKIAPFVPET